MPAVKFTKQFVADALPIGDAPLTDYSATNYKGLHLRVTQNGTKTFCLIFRSRIDGKPQNVKMGRYPEVDLDQAAEWHVEGWKKIARSEPVTFTLASSGEPTVAMRLAEYNSERLTKKRSGRAMLTALTSFIDNYDLAKVPFRSLTKPQLMTPLKAMAVEAPMYASKVQVMLSTFMKWGAINDHIAANPIAGMPPEGGNGKPRSRVLTAAEIRRLWQACHNPQAYQLNPVYADVLLTILTTGCRPGMACGMPRDGELFGFGDFDAPYRATAGAVQDLPEERMKTGLPFVLPLNSLALPIIKRRLADETGNAFVFPTTSDEIQHRGKSARVRRMSQITKHLSEQFGWTKEGQGPGSPFCPHDLRRTASDLLCREYDPRDVDLLLAHNTVTGVMKHYRPAERWNDFEKKRAMSDRLAEMLRDIVAQKTPKLAVVKNAA